MSKPTTYAKIESTSTKFDKHNREVPDRRPLELLLTLQNAVKTNEQRLKELVAKELNKLAVIRGYETLEESNDFDLGDDDSIALSGYEFDEEQQLSHLLPPAAEKPEPKTTTEEEKND